MFVVDIRSHKEKVTPRECIYNEVYCPIFEKYITIDANEGSIFQLFETRRANIKGESLKHLSLQKLMQQFSKNSSFHSVLNI